ncbi:hypothetical protein [Gynuella sunshinyii]|uniref:Uncharacterized protein n=1 Tax=Gynuella sunshinyii YC6258 TaxID=1445510 RepID=A0A0C5VTM0_9GAMM|nr:hypothetical protein [Gynuella sunshinyii]AJQ97531.1 hypothetical Protein YC6258_05503 [Gynuella sunshinyii YC6258]
MSSGESTRNKSTQRVIRLENPDLLKQQNHNVGRKSTFNKDQEMFSPSKAVSTVTEVNRKLQGLSGMPKGMLERSTPKLQQQRNEAQQEVDLAMGRTGSDSQRLSQMMDHKGSSKDSAYVSSTPNWTTGQGSQDEWGLKRLKNSDNFGATVTIADVDSRRVHLNPTNTEEDELLVAGGIKRSEVRYSFWAYPDESRQDGANMTAVLYDHKKDQMTFDNEALRGFIDITNPREMTGKKE